ncbi:MAG: hypothetical protein A2V93_11535 [Ignavibacteria bacterium RBG_16_34_14]|nr:MAG: hypothetical protein A2V93_11535 [Ignavibacteria bacterium RBG_16_34_14]
MSKYDEISKHFKSELEKEARLRKEASQYLNDVPPQLAKYWECDKALISLDKITYSTSTKSYSTSILMNIKNDSGIPIAKQEFKIEGLYRPTITLMFGGNQYALIDLSKLFDSFYEDMIGRSYIKIIEGY